MGRRRLSKSAIKELNAQLARFGVVFDKKDVVEVVAMEAGTFTVVNGVPAFVEFQGMFFPHLKFLQTQQVRLPHLVVDMGAVPHVCDGADVMRPGITAIEGEFVQDDLLIVADERHGRPLAVCSALMDAATARAATTGKVATSVHYVGDSFWKEAL